MNVRSALCVLNKDHCWREPSLIPIRQK